MFQVLHSEYQYKDDQLYNRISRPPITREEVEKAIEIYKIRKATGVCN